MHCLVVGSSGMLGKALKKGVERRGWKLTSVGRREAQYEVDLMNPKELFKLINVVNPDIVVNCSALTDLDLCEKEPECARAVNALTPKYLAQMAEKWGAYFIQVSTDHFYNGDGRKKHQVNEPVVLMNQYASSKLEGENFSLDYSRAIVVRTNIVGFRCTRPKYTFLEWVIKELIAGREITAFSDFFTSGMPVNKLSEILLKLAGKERPTGRWNISGSEVFSKEEFIRAIAEKLQFIDAKIIAGSLENFKGTLRANSLGLDCAPIEKLLDLNLPNLDETVSALAQEYRGSNEIQKFLQDS